MYNNVYYKIVDRMINLFEANGFKQVTYGTEKELDLNKLNSYPLAHIIMPTGSISTDMVTFNFAIVLADKVDLNNIEKYGKDNTIDIQQNLITKYQIVIKQLEERYNSNYDSIELGYIINYNSTFTSFKQDYPNILSGYVAELSISVPSISLC